MDFLMQPSLNSEPDHNGEIKGMVVGMVTNNQDPEGLARVRVHLPWLEASEESYWARIVTPMAMTEQGMFFLPEVGDQVLLGFEQGDPTHPYVLGSLWNGKAKPPASNDDGKNDVRFIRTRSGSELHFLDSDKPAVKLSLEDGKQVLLNDEGILLEDGQGNSLQIESSSGQCEN